MYVKKNVCWLITLAATSSTTNPTHFQEEKNSPKINNCKIVIVITVLGLKIKKKSDLKKKNFTCIPEKVYHTGSAFTQHYY